MSLHPEVTVAAVTQRAGRFLVVEERIARRRLFNQPAGHVEAGETLLAAVVREVREETAWLFLPRSLLGVYRWRNPRNGRTFVRFAFIGSVHDRDAAQPLDTGILRTHWLSAAQLQQQRSRLRSPLVLRCVRDYLQGRCRPLSGVANLQRREALALPGIRL